jgi:hypothetical protein
MLVECLVNGWDTSSDGRLFHSELKRSIKKEQGMKPLLRSEAFHWKDVWATYDTDKDGPVGEFVRFYKETVAPVLFAPPGERENHGERRWLDENIAAARTDPLNAFAMSPMNALLNSPPAAEVNPKQEEHRCATRRASCSPQRKPPSAHSVAEWLGLSEDYD